MVNRTTILLVEDNPLMRELVSEILQRLHPGWHVVTANNGLEGVEVARRNRPDLIVLDFHMPVMNGYEMVLSLQARPDTCHIPLVLNTSEDLNHPLVKQLQSMCNAVLRKPFSPTELDRVLSRFLTQGSAERHKLSPTLQPLVM